MSETYIDDDKSNKHGTSDGGVERIWTLLFYFNHNDKCVRDGVEYRLTIKYPFFELIAKL